MSNVQWIIVDDNDPRISYSGTWSTQGQATLTDMGQFGAPFLLTSHGTTVNSSLSFSFSGTRLVVAGSQLVPVDLNSFGGTCTVDGVAQHIVYTTQNATNRVALCTYQNLPDSRHTLVLSAVPAGHKPLWFDYLRYLPTPGAPTANEYAEVFPDNDNLFFDTNWGTEAPEGVIQVSTNTTNAMMSYTFVGTSIAWYGSYNHSTSLQPANLSYTIDEADPIVVEILPSTKALGDITMEQVIFNASGLSPGITHDLKVTYLGNSQSVPLSLNNLVITRGPLLGPGHNSSSAIPSISGSSLPPLSTNNPSNPPSVSGHGIPQMLKIAVAVSIVGAAIVSGLIAFFIITTRRRRQRASSFKTMKVAQDVSPRPFVSSSTTHSETRSRNSAPTAFLPTSKAQIAQGAQVSLPPGSPAATVGTSIPDANAVSLTPIDHEAATYLWNLLLRHQRASSVQPIQPDGNPAGPSNSGSEVHPPAYDM